MNRQTEPGSAEGPENLFALSLPKGEESFPVLKAFQEFLDAERERARRRQLGLTIAFMAALVVIVVLFSVLGAVLFSGLARRSDAKQDRLLELLLAERKPPAGVLAPPAPEPQADPVVGEMMALLRQLKAETALLKTAAQEREQSAPAPNQETPVERPAPPPRRTGVFSSPRRNPDLPVPSGDAVSDPASAAVVPASVAPAASDAVAATEGGVPETPATVEPAVPVVVVPSRSEEPVPVRVSPARVMRPPRGTEAAEIHVITPDNVRYPWRILVPSPRIEATEGE